MAEQNLLGSIMSSALEFATPFAQSVLQKQTTPKQLQQERVTNNALNGSGPNDPTLANQAPLGLVDFLTGARLTGQSGTSGLQQPRSGISGTMLVVVGVAVVAVFVILSKR